MSGERLNTNTEEYITAFNFTSWVIYSQVGMCRQKMSQFWLQNKKREKIVFQHPWCLLLMGYLDHLDRANSEDLSNFDFLPMKVCICAFSISNFVASLKYPPYKN